MSDQNSDDIKKKQRLHLGIGVAIVIALIAGIVYFSGDDKTKTENNKPDEKAFTSPLAQVNTETHFMERAEGRILAAQKIAEDAKKQLEAAELAQKNSQSEEQVKITQLTERLAELEKQGIPQAQPTPEISPVLPAVPMENLENGAPAQPSSAIRVDTLNLAAVHEDITPTKNPDTYVPSGTFAQAVMIGGADAAASVTSQSNPNPMLFRIIDDGTLPNHRRSHLKDCIVTAAVSGDISSERGHIRLETISCTKPNDEILDITVKGTVFGPEGKNGIRGEPIWREGALLQRALASGMLSGFSNAISQRYTTTSVSPLGSTQTVNGNSIWGYGTAKGASGAMDKLAEYNIKRAEQYHPVIQLSAGTVVDVVFLEGFYLDGRKKSDQNDIGASTSANVSEQQNPIQPAVPANRPPSLPLSARQIQKLQERHKELGFARPDPQPESRNSENDE